METRRTADVFEHGLYGRHIIVKTTEEDPDMYFYEFASQQEAQQKLQDFRSDEDEDETTQYIYWGVTN